MLIAKSLRKNWNVILKGYIETDRCSVNEEELDFSGIYIGEIKIRKTK